MNTAVLEVCPLCDGVTAVKKLGNSSVVACPNCKYEYESSEDNEPATFEQLIKNVCVESTVETFVGSTLYRSVSGIKAVVGLLYPIEAIKLWYVLDNMKSNMVLMSAQFFQERVEQAKSALRERFKK